MPGLVPLLVEARPVMAAASATAAWLGIQDVEPPSEGRATLVMPTRPEMSNRADVVHGGFIALLADSAMGAALHAALPAGESHSTFDLKLNFIAPARIGERLRAVANVLHTGRRTGVTECRVEGEDGRLVATATATFIVRLPDRDT